MRLIINNFQYIYQQICYISLLLLGNAAVLQAQIVPSKPVIIANESQVNSKDLDFCPTFFEDGIVFISSRDAGAKMKAKDKRIELNTMSMFIARRDKEGRLGNPIPFSDDLNTKLHEGPMTFNKTQDIIFFTRNNINNGKIKKDKKKVIHMKIFTAKFANSKWENQVELPFNSDDFDCCHPSIDVEETKLYFASNRPGGFGGMDIWVVEKNGDLWSEPLNLGPKVNSEKNEVFPFIHADGTLFYSSEGHESAGGFDIFQTKQEGDSWKAPENLGKPFNTASDDFGLVVDIDKKNGYFASNRVGGQGQDDIYGFHTDGKVGEPDEELLKVDATLFLSDKVAGTEMDGALVSYILMDNIENADIVTDADGNVLSISGENGDLTMMPIKMDTMRSDADGKVNMRVKPGKYVINIKKDGYQTKQIVKYIDKENNEFLVLTETVNGTIALKGNVVNQLANNQPVAGASITITDDADQSQEILTSDLQGNFEYALKCGHQYTITSAKKGFEKIVKNVAVKDCTKKTYQETLVMSGFSSGLVEGSVVRLPNIYYNFNDDKIRPDATKDLGAVAALLAQFTDMEVELSSHTDARGNKDYNKRLSQRRADNAKNYLKEQGAAVERLTAVGYGESKLKNKCKDGVPCSELDHQYNRRTEVKVTKFRSDFQIEYINNPPEYVGGKDNIVYGETTSTTTDNTSNVNNSASATNAVDDKKGIFHVVAGIFKIADNANKMIARLQALGYNDAHIETTDDGLQRVIVATYTDFYEARSVKESLEAKRIEAVVRKQK